MEYEILEKCAEIPAYDPAAIKVRHIEAGFVGEAAEISEKEVMAVLERVGKGMEAYLFLDPDGEESFLEVLSDGKWLALGCSYDFGQENYYSYNPDYADSREYTPLKSGGQSPIEKRLALTDLEAGRKAVEYFFRTGKPYPSIQWAKQD